MKILIFSDVHGNLPAFETMLKKEGVCDRYICLGDLVNYGPWSNECVDLAMSLPACQYIMGNHEEAFIKGSYPGDNQLVQSFFNICLEGFSKIDEIREFKQSYTLGNYRFQHTINNEYIYPDTTISLDHDYVIGHSHHQFLYKNNGYVLYNAGSVGQNRKYINQINYLILETEHMEFSLCSLSYDVDEVINKMKDLKYPQVCIEYYRTKKRI